MEADAEWSEWVGVIEHSCKLAAKAAAGISVLTLKWLSCQGVPLVTAANQQKIKIMKKRLYSLC